ncbi:MAG: hypothetical protein ABR541_01965 [Candidatus Dormibacteria bacterium]
MSHRPRGLTVPMAGAGATVLCGLLAACGSTPGHPSPAPRQPVAAAPDTARLVGRAPAGGTASLGATTYALDQLAAPTEAQRGAPVLLAVLRASTTGPATHLHTGGITLLDDRGGRWAPVPLPTFVAIDALENSAIEPGSGAAGTVAFRLPAGRVGVAVAISAGGEEVVLDAAP